MVTYDLILERQRLIGADRFSIAANANETVSLHFHFDRSWRRFDSKAAVFRNSASKYYIIEIIENRAKVPWEVLTHTGEFELSVIGFEKEKVITSQKVEIFVSESLMPEDCKILSPSEVLFDRFKRECIAQAYLDYEDEINEMKREHIAEKLALGEKINEANERTEAVLTEKNEEINELEQAHNIETAKLNVRISELNKDIAFYKEKADKWDMIDFAISTKNLPNQSLWAGGTEEFYLPELDTSSITAFTASSFSQKLKGVGLDLSSITAFSAVFSSHKAIETVTLKNCGNVTTFSSLFESCKSIKTVTIDNPEKCNSLTRFANEATQLREVSFGTKVEAENYERAFCNCIVMERINGVLDFTYASNVSMMFANCSNLEEVRIEENSIGLSIDFRSCTRLSKESMISIFNALRAGANQSVSISLYAFENNFSVDERDEWSEYITDTKGWELNLT